jgi:uncharacterized membrane protein HdeD (DUF308 family)
MTLDPKQTQHRDADTAAGGATGPTPVAAPEALRRNWLGVALLGAFLVAGGVVAIAAPVAAGVAATLVIGTVILIGGAIQAWSAFRCDGWRARSWHAISAAVYVVGGVLLLLDPLAGTIALSLLVVAILIVDGAARVMIGLKMRPERGWGWMTGAGGVSAALGVAFAVFVLPQGGLTLLGVVAGCSLLFEGASFIYLAFAVRPESDRSVMPS